MQDTIEIAVYFGLIDSPAQGSFQILDVDTGEVMCDETGKEIKIRGKKNLKPYFEEHPELWRRLYDKVYAKLSQKDDPNIKSFEEMLQIDLNDTFNIDLNRENRDE
jgi:hypothetical protein